MPLSPDALSAIATTVATALGFAVSELRHVRRERQRAAQKAQGIERRETNVNVEISEHLAGLVQDRIDQADALIERTLVANLRGLCGAVDKRMASFEVALKSAISYDQSDRENARLDRQERNEYERGQLAERVSGRQAVNGLLEVTRDLRNLCSRILELFGEPAK